MIGAAIWFFVALLCAVDAFPGGAPKMVCKSLKPSHMMLSAQKEDSPFFLEVDTESIVAADLDGETEGVAVTLNSDDGHTFKGFVLQARDEDGGDAAIGSFTVVGSGAKVLDCSGSQGTVTHSSRADKKRVSFRWTPPLDFEGTVVFRVSVVKSFSKYWTAIQSVPVTVAASKK